MHPVGLEQSRTRDLTFDAVRIVEIHTPAFAPGREAGGFESRDRIGWIVICDAVAVVMQAGLLALEALRKRAISTEEPFHRVASEVIAIAGADSRE
jgi:hypothetical protein